jgi:KDO2-lipid IV(A) lauroyltransferase
VYRDWSPEEVRRFARRVFAEIGRNAYDFLRYPHLSSPRRRELVRFEGEEHLERALAGGRGAIVVTGHLGCWELLAAALVQKGYDLKALARPLREAKLDRLLTEQRRRMGVQTFSSRALPIQAVRHLKQGGLLGVLADQRVKKGGVLVEFLGQPTQMTDAPARLALAAGAPIVPVAIRRLSDQTHLASVTPAILPEGDQARVDALTQAVAGRLEDLILKAPEQWIWIHPRWENAAPATARGRPRPESGKGEACASG